MTPEIQQLAEGVVQAITGRKMIIDRVKRENQRIVIFATFEIGNYHAVLEDQNGWCYFESGENTVPLSPVAQADMAKLNSLL